MNKFSNYTELRTAEDLVRLCEAAAELNRMWFEMMPGVRMFKAREHSQDWQWPQHWHGTLCLLSEKPNPKEQ